MPQRTNEFQELVSLIQKALVPAGAKVTDSQLVGSGKREIDIAIDTVVGPYRIKIAVEAKREGRKMDSTKFESLVGKYFVEGGVRVDKVVVVTSRGFTKPVIERAKKLRVELLTLQEAKSIDWQKFRPNQPAFKTIPRISNIAVTPPLADEFKDAAFSEGRVVCSHGTDFGTLQQFATFLLINNALRNQRQLVQEVDEAAANDADGKKLEAEFLPDHPHVIRMPAGELPLEGLKFVVHFSKASHSQAAVTGEFRFQFAPHVCKVNPDPPIREGTDTEVRDEGRLVCTCCGKDHGTLMEWASKLIFDGYFPKQPETVKQFENALAESPIGQAWLSFGTSMDHNKVVRFRGTDYPVSSISIAVHAISAKAPLACKHYELTGANGDQRILSHLEATAGGKTFSVIIPHVEGGHSGACEESCVS